MDFVENQIGEKIKVFRSDDEGEFKSNNFQKFLKSYGIQHQTSTLYTLQQMGW
jgi:transposase InsO family protein